MDRMTLERRQVRVCLAPVIGGPILERLQPVASAGFETSLRPAPAMLLQTAFVQVPPRHVRDAFRDRRFVIAISLGKIVLIPLMVKPMPAIRGIRRIPENRSIIP